MLTFLKRFTAGKPAPDRELLLAAIPLRNELVEETRNDTGHLRLRAPTRDTLFKRLFARDVARKKSFELDDLGSSVWQSIDGKASVETIITDFAQSHRVNLREAEISVMAFLRLLMQRNLIALAAGDSRRPKPRGHRKKKHH